jgi:hypothetical protein
MIRTIHGVHIPPRRKNSRKVLYTLRFVITGTVPSKKNRQRARISWKAAIVKAKEILKAKGSINLADLFTILRALVPYVSPPPAFDEWEKKAIGIVVEQAAQERLSYPELIFPIGTRCRLKIYHYWADNDVRDNSNKAETLHDVFVKAGIIAGDNWQCLFRNEAEAELYRGEITDHITEISLTVYDRK